MIKKEKQWLSRNDVIDGIQSAGQDKCSSLHTSFLVQESVAYHVNKGNSVYAAFLDTKKAFDTVWIDGLLFKLLKAGMSPKIWRLIKVVTQTSSVQHILMDRQESGSQLSAVYIGGYHYL